MGTGGWSIGLASRLWFLLFGRSPPSAARLPFPRRLSPQLAWQGDIEPRVSRYVNAPGVICGGFEGDPAKRLMLCLLSQVRSLQHAGAPHLGGVGCLVGEVIYFAQRRAGWILWGSRLQRMSF